MHKLRSALERFFLSASESQPERVLVLGVVGSNDDGRDCEGRSPAGSGRKVPHFNWCTPKQRIERRGSEKEGKGREEKGIGVPATKMC